MRLHVVQLRTINQKLILLICFGTYNLAVQFLSCLKILVNSPLITAVWLVTKYSHAVMFSHVTKVHLLHYTFLQVKYGSYFTSSGIHVTEQILCTSENLGLLNSIRQKYTRSGVVQENTYNITWKCFRSLESKWPPLHYLGLDKFC